MKRDAEFKSETKRNKCKAGDKRYCSYAENHPVETFTFITTALVGGPIVEEFVLGGGAAAGLEAAFWRIAQSCVMRTACRWVTGMAGGAGVTSTANNQTCPTCGTNRPDLVRESGRLRIDPDGASVYCRNCVANGATPLDPNGKYWIHTFEEFEQQASNWQVSPPSATPEFGPGHFSTFAGAVGQAWEALNTWIRSGNPPKISP